jgi:gamma-glutamyltranspeptidase
VQAYMGLRRPLVVGSRGAVSTCHPLATVAGLRLLLRGGNAFDAAVGVAAALAVVDPASCGAGGDVFALCYDARRNTVAALNAAGAAPRAATPDLYAGGIPVHGIRSATVPAAVDGWLAVLDRYGSLPVAEVFAPAIEYARDGHPVGFLYAQWIDHYAPLLARDAEAAAIFLPRGRPLRLGDQLVQRDLAATLEAIAHGGRDAFYRGAFANSLLQSSRETDGLFQEADLAPDHASWHDPCTTAYRGYTVYAQPPVSHGFILLEALNILEGMDLQALGRDPVRLMHIMIEIKKLVFADRHAYAGDPGKTPVPLEVLLSKRYAAGRRGALDLDRAATVVRPGLAGAAAGGSDTTYFAVADREGNLASFMQSLYRGFGSGVVIPRTGVLLNNRMGGFSLDPDSPNAVGPERIPVHNMAPNLVGRDGRVFLALGTPGGYSQVQSNFQVLTNLLDFGMNLQEAIDAPRWVHGGITVGGPDDDLTVDAWMPPEVVRGLEARGHRVVVLGQEPPTPRGVNSERTTSRVEAVLIDFSRGAIYAGADPRAEAQAAAW